MGKETSDFRYNTGDTKVPWAAVGENYNAADTFEFVKFLMQPPSPRLRRSRRTQRVVLTMWTSRRGSVARSS